MDYVAGIFGGEKTICWICDLSGNIVAKGESAPARLKRDGINALKASLMFAFFSIAEAIGIKKVKTVALCLPDIDTPKNELIVKALVQSLNIADNVLVYNDSAAVFFGAVAPEGERVRGLVVIGDQGVIGFGAKDYEMCRTGGWEYFLSDEGSAYWIAKKALRACMRSFDWRDDKSSLEEKIVKHYNLKDARDLVDLFYERELDQNFLSPIFEITVVQARRGDEIALKIFEEAADELYGYPMAIIKRLKLENMDFEVAVYGSVFNALRKLDLFKEFEKKIKSIAPNAKFIEPRYEPIYGALALALERETGKFIIPKKK